MPIRAYEARDAGPLAQVFNRAVSETASTHYTADQIAAWLGGGMEAEETHIRCSDGRAVWVAADEIGTAIAFIDLEDDGHIDMLFCLPEWTGRGIASKLYDYLEAEARRRGMARLHVEASELARPFFLRKGFTLQRRNEFTIGGVAIHNDIMEKQLQVTPLGIPPIAG